MIKNNARTSAKIAVELAKLKIENSTVSSNKQINSVDKKQVTVIGGTNLDLSYKLEDEITLSMTGVTQPGEFSQVLGGVGRNMAEALMRLGISNSILISAVGNDVAGRFISEELIKIGMDTSRLYKIDENVSTGSYCALFGTSGDLKTAIGDMKAHDFIKPDFVSKHLEALKSSELCVIDADIPVETIKLVCDFCDKENIPVWFNPTDLRKCTKILSSNCYSKLTFMSPNYKELLTIFNEVLRNEDGHSEAFLSDLSSKYTDKLNKNDEKIEMNDLKLILKYLLKFIPFIVLTRGKEDLVLASSIQLSVDEKGQLPLKNNLAQFKAKPWNPHLYFFPVVDLEKSEKFINVSGAGDSNTSGIIAGMVRGYSLNCSIYNGLLSAKFALQTNGNVSKQLSNIDKAALDKLVEENRSNIKCAPLC